MKLQKLLISTALMLFLNTFSYAIEKQSIEKDVSERIDQALSILDQNNMSRAQQAQKIFNLFDEMFDYGLMAKLALGKNQWLAISSAQRAEFSTLFEKQLKRSYMEKLELYDNQKITIRGTKETRPNSKLQLLTELIGKGEKYPIIYSFYNNKNNWMIYDVDISGVSIIQTYRQQFAGLLKEKSFQELLAQLRTETKTK